MKICVFNLGCKVNKYESDSIARSLREKGHEVICELGKADVYVLNTCAVTNEAERKSRQCVTRCLRLNPAAKVIVAGCASQANAEQFGKKAGVVFVSGVAGKNKIAEEMQEELQKRVADAGIEIIDVRLNQIAYAPEIAAAMLQRQQATAIIAARRKIVEGAVSMVEMALDRLKTDGVVDLDDERRAQMVGNLMVVLCSNREANPVVNAGSIY